MKPSILDFNSIPFQSFLIAASFYCCCPVTQVLGEREISITLSEFNATAGIMATNRKCFFSTPSCTADCKYDPSAKCRLSCPIKNDGFCMFGFVLNFLTEKTGGHPSSSEMVAINEEPFMIQPRVPGKNVTLNATGSYDSWTNPGSILVSDETFSRGILLSIIVTNENGYPAGSLLFANSFITRIDQLSARGNLVLTSVMNPTYYLHVNVDVTGAQTGSTSNNRLVTSTTSTNGPETSPVAEDGKTAWIILWVMVGISALLLVLVIVLAFVVSQMDFSMFMQLIGQRRKQSEQKQALAVSRSSGVIGHYEGARRISLSPTDEYPQQPGGAGGSPSRRSSVQNLGVNEGTPSQPRVAIVEHRSSYPMNSQTRPNIPPPRHPPAAAYDDRRSQF